MYKPKLYIMVGLSGSGKSTIAKELSVTEDCEIVSSDEIRGEICKGGVADQSQNQEVFRIFHKRIVDFLREGKNVIADATNISIKSRRSLLSNVSYINCFKIAYIVPKSVEKCIEDNIDREYPVPHHVIQKQMMNFQIPFIEEGFDEIIIHKFDKEYNITFTDIFYKMEGFDQKNPHHNMTLDEHCLRVSWWFSMAKDLLNFERGAFIHDIGKLFTQKIDENGVAHYYQHENVGSYYILSNFNNLDKETEKILDVCFLINYHMLPMNWDTEKTETKWRGIFGDRKFEMLKFFNECDKAR